VISASGTSTANCGPATEASVTWIVTGAEPTPLTRRTLLNQSVDPAAIGPPLKFDGMALTDGVARSSSSSSVGRQRRGADEGRVAAAGPRRVGRKNQRMGETPQGWKAAGGLVRRRGIVRPPTNSAVCLPGGNCHPPARPPRDFASAGSYLFVGIFARGQNAMFIPASRLSRAT
jgi:hypothetical protein